MIDEAKVTTAKADAALAEVTKDREGIAQERAAILDAASEEAATASKATLAEAAAKAEALLAAAEITIAQNSAAARKTNASQATDLSLQIAARLLKRLNGTAAQSAFLPQLVEAIANMSAADRAALVDTPSCLEIVTATEMHAEKEAIKAAVQTALGGTPDLKFVTDPSLIGGLELRSPHFVLRNSWQADLKDVQKAVLDAA